MSHTVGSGIHDAHSNLALFEHHRLVGNVIRGVGDAMLLAGEATETIAASTTGVAEDIVRIIEDFAGTLSSAVSPDGREREGSTLR